MNRAKSWRQRTVSPIPYTPLPQAPPPSTNITPPQLFAQPSTTPFPSTPTSIIPFQQPSFNSSLLPSLKQSDKLTVEPSTMLLEHPSYKSQPPPPSTHVSPTTTFITEPPIHITPSPSIQSPISTPITQQSIADSTTTLDLVCEYLFDGLRDLHHHSANQDLRIKQLEQKLLLKSDIIANLRLQLQNQASLLRIYKSNACIDLENILCQESLLHSY